MSLISDFALISKLTARSKLPSRIAFISLENHFYHTQVGSESLSVKSRLGLVLSRIGLMACHSTLGWLKKASVSKWRSK